MKNRDSSGAVKPSPRSILICLASLLLMLKRSRKADHSGYPPNCVAVVLVNRTFTCPQSMALKRLSGTGRLWPFFLTDFA